MRRNGMRGVGDETEIRFVVLVQRSGHADDNGVHRGELSVVRGGGKSLRLCGLDFLGSDAVDVGAALCQGVDFAGIDIESRYLELLFAVQQSQRQANVSEAD